MLRVEHLYKNYQTGNQTYPVLRDVSFEVEKGEFVAVMGLSLIHISGFSRRRQLPAHGMR